MVYKSPGELFLLSPISLCSSHTGEGVSPIGLLPGTRFLETSAYLPLPILEASIQHYLTRELLHDHFMEIVCSTTTDTTDFSFLLILPIVLHCIYHNLVPCCWAVSSIEAPCRKSATFFPHYYNPSTYDWHILVWQILVTQ